MKLELKLILDFPIECLFPKLKRFPSPDKTSDNPRLNSNTCRAGVRQGGDGHSRPRESALDEGPHFATAPVRNI